MTDRLVRLVRGRIADRDRRLLAQIFAALIPAESGLELDAGEVDGARLLAALEDATAPSFLPGLAAMLLFVRAASFAKHRRSFESLARDERIAFFEALATDERYLVRQIVTSLKMLACLTYFDDERVRARFESRPA